MRALDTHAIDELGIPGIVLMENAALAVLSAIEERYDDVEDLYIAVVCGPGNNGGDGLALARHLSLRGSDVDVYVIGDPHAYRGDAQTNFRLAEKLDIPVIRLEDGPEGVSLEDYDLIVDAIFGTGAVRAPAGVVLDAISAINESGVPVIAIDLPSGVDASTGDGPGAAVMASLTVALQHAKLGHFLPPGRDYCGDVMVAPISIPTPNDNRFRFDVVLPEDVDVDELLPRRERGAHKGDCGKLLIIAGSRGMSGAARLVALAALRSGVGLVKVACPASVRAEVAAAAPELMTIALPETEHGFIGEQAAEVLKQYLDWPDVIAVGPGLGRDEETALFLSKLFSIYRAFKFVIDADALNLIAEDKLEKQIPPQSILTPHPGEFDRLIAATGTAPFPGGQGGGSSFFSRLSRLRSVADQWGLATVLKGSPTVTQGDGALIVNPTGNPGLATGGTGDVLTGIIAALWAQGLDAGDAAWVGAFLHGRSADIAVETLGEASLVATDVIRFLPAALRSVGEPESDPHEHSA